MTTAFPRAKVISCMLFCVAGSAQAQGVPTDVMVQSVASRTAVWTGDRVEFVVDIDAPSNAALLEEDFAADRLRTAGFDVLSLESLRTERPDGRVAHRLTYQLVTYESGITTLRVEPFTLRYRLGRPNEPLTTGVSPSSVTVPGAVVALRSTLPDAIEELKPRSSQSPNLALRGHRLAMPLGIAGLILSVAPLVVAGATHLRAIRAKRLRRPRTRGMRAQARTLLERLAAMDASTVVGRREAYIALDEGLREYLQQASGVPARALTASELRVRLEKGPHGKGAATFAAVLSDCETARYAPASRLPSADSLSRSLSEVQQMLLGTLR
jgi:hypothetical protein